MRTPLLLTATLLLAVGFIYYAGNIPSSNTPRPHPNPTVQQPPTAAPAPDAPLTTDQARQLTSQQRLDLFRKCLATYKEESEDHLCNLISAITKEELVEVSAIIEDKINRLSTLVYTFSIIEALAKQWGRLDAATWFEKATKDAPLPQEGYGRIVMNAWFETDPAAALAWAQSPERSLNEVEMAAYAITQSAAGDPQKLAAALLALPAGDRKIGYCLLDYFDLIATTTGKPYPATIYENIPAPLREVAWPISMQHLHDADPQAAADWLTAHVNDPVREYSVARELIWQLSANDHAGTAQWAATFPDDEGWGPWWHPAHAATLTWFKKDPEAAKAWLQTQPSALHWVAYTLKDIEEQEASKEPEADTMER